MASSWRYGKRSKYRAKVSQDPEDFYCLDPKKSAAKNAYDIYTALFSRETRDTKRLFLLNGLATLSQHQQQQMQQHLQPPTPQPQPPSQQLQQQTEDGSMGFTTEELLYCLSVSLVHTFTQVRAAALRTIRYVLSTPKDIKIFNSMQMQYLLCRCIDVLLRNDDERVQALKLIRKMLSISPADISPVLVRCLVSLADSGSEDGDNMLRACLATLCEFAVLNPTLLVVCGGVTSITRNVLECHNPRIAESLCGVLLYLLEWPQTRNISGVRLDCLAAPYCDFTYRLGIMDKNKDARELRYTSCRLALLSVLRSWTGTIEFCDPSKPSGLKAIVDALYLNQVEVRKAILDLLYELLGLPQPAWTDDYSIALQAVDPSDFQDAWLLSNGFVAMEGRCILPSLAARAPNVCEQHLSLLLYCFLETGLLNALIEVIVGDDTHISVRATVLIGKILHLMHTHLPPDICSTSPALPTLMSHATQGNQQATAAISALQNYQKMLRNRPASCSLFLDSIIQSGSLIHTRLFRRDISAQGQLHVGSMQSPGVYGPPQTDAAGSTLDRPRLDSVSSDESNSSKTSSSRRSSFRLKRKILPFFENLRVNRLIKDSNVLSQSDVNSWDWDMVITMLRSNVIRKIDDVTGKFFRRLVDYFKPSSNRFSHQDLAHGRAVPPYVTAGLDLIDWLLACNELESVRILTDFFSDVSIHLLAVSTSSRAHDCLFSPQHMNNTMCQQYFLYIGRMSRVQKGIVILTNTAVFEHLKNLVRNTDHVCYVKLIVSGLDYSLDSTTRKVLERALTASKTRSGRLYATQFLVVLLRARIPNFEVWGIPLIVQQTKDRDRSVVLAAIDVLEEACHEKYYLEEIVSLWPNLKPLGDVGRLVMARYYSLPRGLNHSRARTQEEIDYWRNGYNKRYVLLVEADTHSSLTLHVRNEDGYYSRRNCNTRPVIIPPNIPPHLYGQLVQTAQGTTALRKYVDLSHLIEVVSRGKCTDDVECLELKAAIWAVGHASTHKNGIDYFVETGSRIYEKLVILATKCDVYSIRATCFNVLGLIGGSNTGANILFKLNWLSVRHDRNTVWPVHRPEDWMSSHTPVRHHYEDMPPYNYVNFTGMEDQLDGSYITASYWNLLLSSSSTTKEGGAASASSEAQDANTTAESSKASGGGGACASDESARMPPVAPLAAAIAAKSKTLPEGTYMRHGKHQRSLSESKTTDVISMLGGGAVAQYQHRVRYNSYTDSNTSGVSSCESVTARVPPGHNLEHQPFPLSPIPSMSNLLELPPSAVALRGTSLIGTTFLQNAISPADVMGYAQLRSLRRHCRPVVSEPTIDLYDIIDCNLKSFASLRPRKSSFGESQRRMKVRSLDRQSSLRMFTQLDSEELQVPLPTLAAPKFLSQNDSEGPCYAGICLPKNLLDLFPPRNLARTYVSRDIQDQDLMDINLLTAKQQFLNDSLNNEGGDESSVISSLSDVSSVSKRSKWLGAKHGRSNCLHCSRPRRNRTHAQRFDNNDGACELYTSTSAALMAAGIQATVVFGRKTGAATTTTASAGVVVTAAAVKPPNTQSSSTIQLSDFSFNSPESILSEESMPDRLTANILYNVQRLANPVSAKQSKLSLLELKQKHPATFQDICLYSEVCKTLGRSSYRMNARRFLQELFLDLNFDSFYTEPFAIIAKKDKEFATSERVVAASSVPTATIEYESLPMASGSSAPPALRGPRSFLEHASASSTKTSSRTNIDAAASSTGLAPTPTQAPTAVTTTTNTNYPMVLKSQRKPLASVYETSCENLLLEQSPRLQALVTVAGGSLPKSVEKGARETLTTIAKPTISTSKKSLFAVAPPPAAPPPYPVTSDIKNMLVITSDDDDDGDDVTGGYSPNRLFPLPNAMLGSATATGSSQANASTISTPISSSNCSDQTSNSNRSSICTISHQPVGGGSANQSSGSGGCAVDSNANASCATPLENENENKKYTRGRFYTLELDLSCTKNKFPIRHRTAGRVPLRLRETGDHKLPRELLVRQSYTAGVQPKNVYMSEETPAMNSADAGADGGCSGASDLLPLSSLALTITKSLAASLAKPIGSLYCEKRLQSSKSEAILTNVAPIATTSRHVDPDH